METKSLLGALLSILAQDASIPALRAILFLFGGCGAFAWFRGARRLALSLIMAGGFLGLSFWFVQIRAPFGFGTDAELTREWAQAGVNAAGAFIRIPVAVVFDCDILSRVVGSCPGTSD